MVGCAPKINLTTLPQVNNPVKVNVEKDKLKHWQYKDYTEDSLPGISLERAYRDIIKNKAGKPVVVAIIDTEIDINHEDLKGQIWTNPKEIPDNKKDDDNNGYVDDIHGFNYNIKCLNIAIIEIGINGTDHKRILTRIQI